MSLGEFAVYTWLDVGSWVLQRWVRACHSAGVGHGSCPFTSQSLSREDMGGACSHVGHKRPCEAMTYAQYSPVSAPARVTCWRRLVCGVSNARCRQEVGWQHPDGFSLAAS